MEKTYQFFYPCGKPMVDVQEFIKFYNHAYYWSSKEKPVIKGLKRTAKCIEEEIDYILKNGIKSKLDVVKILAWKIGKIRHPDSQRLNTFCYAEDWKNAESFQVKRYKKDMPLNDVCTYILKNITELELTAQKDPQGLFEQLYNQNWYGIGPVYYYTLLYFLSKGKCPIYDQFAEIALTAIENGIDPSQKIHYSAPEIKKKYIERYNKYEENLTIIFNHTYRDTINRQDRSLDRALWVYGHLFKAPSKETEKR